MSKSPKLNDLQLILLSSASQREEANLLPLPEAASKDLPRARKAIETLLKTSLAAEAETNQLDRVWREEDDRRYTVVITGEGRSALGLGDSGGGEPPADTAGNAKDRPSATKRNAEARSGSKKALLIEMLQRAGGVSLDELVQATGWLPHTTRAAITGVRKDHEVTKQKVDGVTRYSISGGAAQ